VVELISIPTLERCRLFFKTPNTDAIFSVYLQYLSHPTPIK
jgi:hypothetical protein